MDIERFKLTPSGGPMCPVNISEGWKVETLFPRHLHLTLASNIALIVVVVSYDLIASDLMMVSITSK